MSTNDFQIRPCQSDDIAAVLAFWQRAGAQPRPTDHVDALQLRLQRDPQLFLLAFDADRLIGSLMGGWDGWRGNMYRLAVDPTHRRRGIAQRLVVEVETQLRALGAERITILVFEGEPGAADFWRGAGYLRDGETARYAKNLDSA